MPSPSSTPPTTIRASRRTCSRRMCRWWDRATCRTRFSRTRTSTLRARPWTPCIYSQVAVAQGQNAKSIGVMYCAEAPTCAAAVTPFKQAGQTLGLTVPVSLKIPATHRTTRPPASPPRRPMQTAHLVLQAFAAVNHVISDCTKQNYHPVWVADGLDVAPSFANVPGGLYLNVTNVPYFCGHTGEHDHERRLRQVLPGPADQPELQRGLGLAVGLRPAVRGPAAKAGGLGVNGSTPTSAQLVQGLNSLRGETLDGMAPPLTFHLGQPHPVDCWFTAQMGWQGQSSDRHPDAV